MQPTPSLCSTSSSSPYDAVRYPSAVYAQTHPDRLATAGLLFGLRPAPVTRARVLELGCGEGTNLIAMAVSLPESRFYGFDLAAEPIRAGRRLVEALGLNNLQLDRVDLMDLPKDLGEFDYIIAHGLYSWVPEPVREKLLSLCNGHLAAQGVAYISYNAYPGNHLRDLSRGMLRFHLQQFSEPQEKVRQARTLLKFLAEAKTKPNRWQQILTQEFERVQGYVDAGFYHDDLGPVNQPFYFHEFMAGAARHHLQFLAEADLPDMQVWGLTDEATAVVRNLEDCNLIAREQYLDFIAGRAFRQTLLCREEACLSRELVPERVFDMFVASDTHPADPEADLARELPQDFQRGKAVAGTTNPLLKGALAVLGERWPHRLHFSELRRCAAERVRRGPVSSGAAVDNGDARDLGDFLQRCYAVGFADLHVSASPFVTTISERPRTARLARLHLQFGPVVCSLRHKTLRIEDALGRLLIALCDGTRDRGALLEGLFDAVLAGRAEVLRDGVPLSNPAAIQEALSGGLEQNLRNLAALGLLEA